MSHQAAKEKAIVLSGAIAEMKETFMLRLELFDVLAKDQRAKYSAYVAAGFSSDQAMQLCCAELHK